MVQATSVHNSVSLEEGEDVHRGDRAGIRRIVGADERICAGRKEFGSVGVRVIEVFGDEQGIRYESTGGCVVDQRESRMRRPVRFLLRRRNTVLLVERNDVWVLNPFALEGQALVVQRIPDLSSKFR